MYPNLQECRRISSRRPGDTVARTMKSELRVTLRIEYSTSKDCVTDSGQ